MKKVFVLLMMLMYSVSYAGWTDISEKAGVADSGLGKGVAWADINNDGYVDLYVSNKGGSNKLYLNNKNGTFTDVTDISGKEVGYTGLSTGSVFGDYDNDGDQDLLIANGNDTNLLLSNDGRGKFTNVTKERGINRRGFSYSTSFADYDNDGDLDIFAASWGVGERGILYRNDNNNHYTNVTDEVGITAVAWTWMGIWSDVDLDGDQDLYLVNGRYPAGEPNRLYINNKGKFTEEAKARGVDDPDWGLGASFADVDNDGDNDLFVSNYQGGNHLYKNDGKGYFDLSVRMEGFWGKGPTFGDVDHDGWMDFYEGDCKENNQMWMNETPKEGVINFNDIAYKDTKLQCNNVRTKGTAFADIDNDGDLDLYVVNWGAPNKLFRNDQNDKNWLKVKAVGTKTNKGGIGAKVNVYHKGKLVAYREIRTATGFCAQEPNIAHFGLDGKKTYTVVVTFTNGAKTIYTDVEPGNLLNAIEGGHQ